VTDIEAWVDAHVERTGPVVLTRERPWGRVWRAPTALGPVWIKEPGAGTRFEVPLYGLLARVVPEDVLVPIAIDEARGRLLLPDGGPPLRDREDWLDGLVEALVEYGRLQRALAPYAAEMLALGVHDMRPAVMPARFEEALAAAGDLPEVAALAPRVGEWCERLAASPLPASLDHNDLHPGNVLAGPRYYDWGDAVLAHPFAVALVPLGMIAARHGEAALVRARDAYLAGFGEPGELVETLELACRVAKIARALTWVRAIQAGGGAVDPDWADAPANTLALLLAPGYLLSQTGA
jgi:hypothetical protein